MTQPSKWSTAVISLWPTYGSIPVFFHLSPGSGSERDMRLRVSNRITGIIWPLKTSMYLLQSGFFLMNFEKNLPLLVNRYMQSFANPGFYYDCILIMLRPIFYLAIRLLVPIYKDSRQFLQMHNFSCELRIHCTFMRPQGT